MGLNREFCMCGVHVHTATRVIAIVFLTLAALSFVSDVVGYVRDRASARAILGSVFGNILVCSVNIFLLFGNLKQRPNFYWPFIVLHIISVVAGFIIAILLLIFGSTIFSVVESLPKDLPQLQMPNQQSQPLFPYQESNEKYHAPKPFYGNYNHAKINLHTQLNTQEEYHAVRQLAEAIGGSISALIIFGAILMMLMCSFYAYLVSVVIRGYRYLRSTQTLTVYNKLADDQPRFTN